VTVLASKPNRMSDPPAAPSLPLLMVIIAAGLAHTAGSFLLDIHNTLLDVAALILPLFLIRESYRWIYWSQHRGYFHAWKAMLVMVHAMPRILHFHTLDGTCFRTDSRPVGGDVWHFVVEVPGDDNLLRDDGVSVATVRVYVITHNNPRMTMHLVGLTAQPGQRSQGWDRDTLNRIVEERRRGEAAAAGLLETDTDTIGQLLQRMRTSWPVRPGPGPA
jgi:hypothetical protein